MSSIEEAKSLLRNESIIKDAAKKIYSSLTIGKTPSDNPTAIIIGAQPGAGKSGLAINSLKTLGPNSIELDVDYFRAFAIPYIQDVLQSNPDMFVSITNEFYNTLNAIIQPRLIKDGYDLVFHRTFRSAGPLIEDTIIPLQNQNYNIIIRGLAVHALESLTSSVERAQVLREHTGLTRWVYPDYHKNNYEAIPQVISQLASEEYANCIQIFKRGETPDKPIMIYSKVLSAVPDQPNIQDLGEYDYNAETPIKEAFEKGRNEDLPDILKSMPKRIENIEGNIQTEEETKIVNYLKDLYQEYNQQFGSGSQSTDSSAQE